MQLQDVLTFVTQAGADVAFSSAERDRHPGIRPVSQLNTQPVVSPVNASRRPSRDAAHHSGPGRLARPYPVEDLHLLSFASFPGALRFGSKSAVPSVIEHSRSTFNCGRIVTCASRPEVVDQNWKLETVNRPPTETSSKTALNRGCCSENEHEAERAAVP